MKRSRKGFTVTELAIVIAVIAVLAAVLIPSFVGLVAKANLTRDEQTVRSINMLLTADKALGGTHDTMHDVITLAAQNGIAKSAFNASVSGNVILWDSVNDAVCYYRADGEEYDYISSSITPVDDYHYFALYSTTPSVQKYSIYWDSDAAFADTLTVGFDAGDNDGAFTVEYVRPGASQTVIIRTCGQSLSINAPNDTVNHYGYVSVLNVTAVSMLDCYREFGTVGELESFVSGKLVAEKGSKFVQSMSDISSFASAQNDIDVSSGAEFDYILPSDTPDTSDDSTDESSQGESSNAESSSDTVSTECTHDFTDYVNAGTKHIRKCVICGKTETESHEECQACSKCHYCNDIAVAIYTDDDTFECAWTDSFVSSAFAISGGEITFKSSGWGNLLNSHDIEDQYTAIIYLPDGKGITSICGFDKLTWLTEIYLPYGLQVIGSGAFDGDVNLTKVGMSSSITQIDELAFYGCTSLLTLTVPAGVTNIVSTAFTNCPAQLKYFNTTD